MGGRGGPRPPATERRRVEVDGASVAYRVAGDGPPVVLVHGLAGSGRWWDRTVAPLSERFRVLAVDLPGFGASHNRGRFALADAGALLVAWLDRLGMERAAWVGHSMGGQIVADVAADAPDRVARLVLVDAPIFPTGPKWPFSVRGLVGALRHAPPTLAARAAVDAARAGPRTLLRAGHDVLTTGVEDKASRIVAPTLVVWGEHDAIVPPSVGRRVAALAPRARLVVVSGAGHAPMWSQPEAFNAVVGAFLAEPGPNGSRWD